MTIRISCLLHFVAFFYVASLFSTGVDNEKVGVDNEKALELTNSTVFHRGRQRENTIRDSLQKFIKSFILGGTGLNGNKLK